MRDFVEGQRWLSMAEPQLGLGIIVEADRRRVSVRFPARDQTRIYAVASAPLARAVFAVGDQIMSQGQDCLEIQRVDQDQGLLCYAGQTKSGDYMEIDERELDHHSRLDRPADRLFSGQIDAIKWYKLRHQAREVAARLDSNRLYGLAGARTSLIEHQLYIAAEIGKRFAPRVLLADEVGLGKTIEAGLILHQQLLMGRASRVLVLVPDSLVYQWMVEMLRRFNLRFRILDEDNYLAIQASDPDSNPFESDQLLICPMSFLLAEEQRQQLARQASWDCLVVDEAHHLEWTPEAESEAYACVRELAESIPGILLLTATPEQLGKGGHFARLHLLDPDRFPNLESYLKDESDYESVASLVQRLSHPGVFDDSLFASLDELNDDSLVPLIEQIRSEEGKDNPELRQLLIADLLDLHGTGRVLFRNTRALIKGFPERHVTSYPLAIPDAYTPMLDSMQTLDFSEARLLLCPEVLYQVIQEGGASWTQVDPRMNWLSQKIRALRPSKVLVIAAQAQSVQALAKALREQTGILAAVFHEGMDIIERDRAAAWFADPDDGAQVLICSESGSEGRNFQFAHHLVLFDLPLDPDLLEQRIGRLDRIGQRQRIEIHVPYLQGSAQEKLYRWYQDGLGAFENICPAAQSVYTEMKQRLATVISTQALAPEELDAFVQQTRSRYKQLETELHQGRDPLLETNSCRPHIAKRLVKEAIQLENPDELLYFMEEVFDCYGVDSEIHSANSFVLRPGPHMQENSFPELPEEGTTVTYHREVALANEDRKFLTWEHPMVSGAVAMILESERGNSCVATLKIPGIEPGTLVLETQFVFEPGAGRKLGHRQFLQTSMTRFLVDAQGNDLSTEFSLETLNRGIDRIPDETSVKIVDACAKQVREMLSFTTKLAQDLVPEARSEALNQCQTLLGDELARLLKLKKRNPLVRDDEVEFFQSLQENYKKAIEQTDLRLDALRLMLAT